MSSHQGSLYSPNAALWEAFPNIMLCLFQQSGFLGGFPHFLSAFKVFSPSFYAWLVRQRKIWALCRGSQFDWKWEWHLHLQCVFSDLGWHPGSFPSQHVCWHMYWVCLKNGNKIKLPYAGLFTSDKFWWHLYFYSCFGDNSVNINVINIKAYWVLIILE